MARKIFISYSRNDQAAARFFHERLRNVGHEVWMDSHLTGGAEWWQAILSAIRWCDVFLPLISQQSVHSQACRSELDYAEGLARPIVPLQVGGPVGRRGMPPALAERQWIDGQVDGERAVTEVFRAINTLAAAPPLPAQWPSDPPVPISYVTHLQARLGGSLDRQAQDEVLNEIQLRAAQGEEPEDLLDLLNVLSGHPDLLHQTSLRIAQVRPDLERAVAMRHPQAAMPHVRPTGVPTAAGPSPPMGRPPAVGAPPTAKSGMVKGIVIGAVVAVLLLVGGCVALISAANQDSGNSGDTGFTPCDLDFDGINESLC